MSEFESNVCGIPCIIRVTHYDHYQPAFISGPPPKPEWVGLTDDDLVMCESEEDVKFVRAIEAKLKEKNT